MPRSPVAPAGLRIQFSFDEDVAAGVEALLVILRRAECRRLADDSIPDLFSPNPAKTDEKAPTEAPS
jgi:hypothetical protein